MKKMQIRDALRNILKQKVSYLSIVLIAFLGVAAFLGIGYSGDALLRNATDAYERAGFRDLEIVTPLLLSDDMFREIRETEGVADAEKVWQTSAKVSAGGRRKEVSVLSMTERINLPELTDGRLPADPSECAAEERLAEELGWHTGDTIELPDAAGNTPRFLKRREYTVTGIVRHPDHMNPDAPEAPYVVVTPDAFDMGPFSGSFMKAEVAAEREAGLNRFLPEYDRAVSATAGRIREWAGKQAPDTDVFVNDCRSNSSFMNVVTDGENLSNLKMTFSMLFVLVGALVIYATISKMIDEQRNLVGATKALGLYNREIFRKYLFYGVSSTLLGTLLGILTARLALESFVLHEYNVFYTFDTTRPVLSVVPTLVVLGAGILLAVAAAWLACSRLLRSAAITLMQPKVPPRHRQSAREKRHVLPLYSRLILRNIRTDLRRVTVTIVSVAGCCALVVIGFTLKNAVEGALKRQYPQITAYDVKVTFDNGTNKDAGSEIGRFLEEAGAETVEVSENYITYRTENTDAGQLLCGDPAALGTMIRLLDPDTGKPLPAGGEGVYIPVRVAETCGLKTGDELEISLGGIIPANVRVAGVYDNYIGRTMLMSRNTYEDAFGRTAVSNAFLVKLGESGREAAEEAVRGVKGFDDIVSADSDRKIFESATSVINGVVALLIVLAALMAGVVLMNLTNMYMLQKKQELTIMRINGFTVREGIRYVLRETVVTTALGILGGFGLGSLTAYRIIRALEQAYTKFERGISLPAWLTGAAITLVFAVLVNRAALRKIRTLSLTDIG